MQTHPAPTARPGPALEATLAAAFEASGVGLHTGATVRARVCPAPPRTGLHLVRVDRPGAPTIPATLANVRSTRLATTLAVGDVGVSTVEHLIAALVAAGIDNARVEVDGPELPVLDGSARPWVRHIDAAGRREQATPARHLVVRRHVEVSSGARRMALHPAPALTLSATVDFPHPLIGAQHLALPLTAASFRAELAWARTFGFLRDIEALREAGLALGGTLSNAVVYDRVGVVNPDGLRAEDEPVRHKLLDVVGDLGLLGARLVGRVEATRPGHGLTHALLRALLADPGAYTLTP
ncbi:MAG: UDP-3-O-[3-hydroxymyristoyl] N-acetylglucosamine deacetylase [Alphaproteobacteria bacterium]|nr:UDP-3-O-[3-hydroxymyristoyl] N-acetylglucosamine deacetylase [Alphaproteobacteria bacterium]